MDERAKKPYQVRLPGGELPEIGRLLQETVTDLQDHFGDYLVAGAIHFVVVVTVVLVGAVVGYLGGFVGMFGLILGAAGVMVWAEQALGTDTAGLLAIPLQLTALALFFLGVAVFAGAFGAILAPMTASMYRAIAAHQRGEGRLEPGAAFSSLGERWTGAVTAGVATATLFVFGSVFCYVPALLVPVVFGFAVPLAALHPIGGLRAMAVSARFTAARAPWAVPFGLLLLVGWMVGGNVPVLGPAFVMALHVRAHRYVFGDGEAPDFQALGSLSGDTNT